MGDEIFPHTSQRENKMKNRDIVNLINRAIAALETPDDLADYEKYELIEDLSELSEEFSKA